MSTLVTTKKMEVWQTQIRIAKRSQHGLLG